MIDIIITKIFPLCFKKGERLENLDNILRDWEKEKVQKSLVDALNRYEKQKEEEKNVSFLSLFQALCQCGRLKKLEKAGRRRAGSGRERGSDGRTCKHCFKKLIPVYQLLVYPLIGYFLTVCINILSFCLKRSDA